MVERWTFSRSAASSMVASTLGYRAGVAPQRAPRMFGENHGERHGEKYEKTPAEQGLPSVHLLLAKVRVAGSNPVVRSLEGARNTPSAFVYYGSH